MDRKKSWQRKILTTAFDTDYYLTTSYNEGYSLYTLMNRYRLGSARRLGLPLTALTIRSGLNEELAKWA